MSEVSLTGTDQSNFTRAEIYTYESKPTFQLIMIMLIHSLAKSVKALAGVEPTALEHHVRDWGKLTYDTLRETGRLPNRVSQSEREG